jgi:hypothetical protein
MSTMVEGLLEIEDCGAGPGSCIGNCGSPACSNNAHMMSYSRYTECAGEACDDQPHGTLLDVRCGGSLTLNSYCGASNTTARLWDCGPPAGNRTDCHFSCWEVPFLCTLPIIGCGNTALLTHMMNGGNPTTWGAVLVGLTD